MLKLIAAKDAMAAGSSRGDDQLGELEDNLYEVTQRLEEERERASGLEASQAELTAQLQTERQASLLQAAALREAQQELEDECTARTRADKQLAQALGQG